MSNEEQYTAIVPDWATSKEIVIHNPEDERAEVSLNLKNSNNCLFLIAVVTTPNGFSPPYLDAKMDIIDSHIRGYDTYDNSQIFLSPNLVIINNPDDNDWNFRASGLVNPFALNVLAFHPAILPNSPPSPGSSGNSPFKCKACKTTAKALALAIIAAATLPVLPQALIAAVSAYLGASVIIAAAFISSVLGDTATEIAEKLCKKVGLC